MRLQAMLLLVLLAGAAAAAEESSQRLVYFSTDARVGVDSRGNVVGVTVDPSLSPAIRGVIEGSVKQWRFSVPAKAGQPVGGTTFVHLDACAAPIEGKFRFSVRYRGNGPGHAGKLEVPDYPNTALRRGETGKLKLDIRVLPDGTAQVEEMTLVEGSDHAERPFRESIRTWLARNRFQSEQVDGAPVATKVALPVVFFTDRKDYLGSTAYVDVGNERAMRELAAQQTDCQALLDAGDKLERQTAQDSPFHLILAN